MARIKHYNHKTNKWEYADSNFTAGGNIDYYEQPEAPDDAPVGSLWYDTDEMPPEESGGISITGAKVGQTVKIAEVDENGVPTAWLPTDFPSGGGGGGSNAFKLLASVEPITEPVQKISVAIEEDGISEIYLVGKIKQAEDNSYSYAYIGVNNRSVSFNFGIKTTVEHLLTYHGVILEGGHWLMTMRVNQHWGQAGEYILTAPQGGFDNYPEEVNEVCIAHSGGGMLAIGTYFEVWGR